MGQFFRGLLVGWLLGWLVITRIIIIFIIDISIKWCTIVYWLIAMLLLRAIKILIENSCQKYMVYDTHCKISIIISSVERKPKAISEKYTLQQENSVKELTKINGSYKQ